MLYKICQLLVYVFYLSDHFVKFRVIAIVRSNIADVFLYELCLPCLLTLILL